MYVPGNVRYIFFSLSLLGYTEFCRERLFIVALDHDFQSKHGGGLFSEEI